MTENRKTFRMSPPRRCCCRTRSDGPSKCGQAKAFVISRQLIGVRAPPVAGDPRSASHFPRIGAMIPAKGSEPCPNRSRRGNRAPSLNQSPSSTRIVASARKGSFQRCPSYGRGRTVPFFWMMNEIANYDISRFFLGHASSGTNLFLIRECIEIRLD